MFLPSSGSPHPLTPETGEPLPAVSNKILGRHPAPVSPLGDGRGPISKTATTSFQTLFPVHLIFPGTRLR